MYDVNKLIEMVYTALEDEREMKEYCIKIRKDKGKSKGDLIYIEHINGITAYRVGEL